MNDPLGITAGLNAIAQSPRLALVYLIDAGTYSLHRESCKNARPTQSSDLFRERFDTKEAAGKFAQCIESAKGGDAIMRVCKCARV